MRVLGIVPARGGSKGVPRKNIRLLNGKPLLQYTADAALGSRRLSQVILSTEDTEIAEVGRRCGLQVPFIRPVELAQDDTPSLPVAQHALRWMEDHGELFDAVCLLQPTCPLRGPEVVDSCIELFVDRRADAVITVIPVPAEYNPHWVFFRDDNGFLRLTTGEINPITRRQALPPAFIRDGAVYVTRRSVLIEENSLYGRNSVGYLMDPTQSVNIDGVDDWERAEQLLRARRDKSPVERLT